MKTTEKKTIRIDELRKEHEKGALELFVSSFCDSEPITRHLNINHNEYLPFAKDVIKKAIQDKLSIVVLDRYDKVIGLIIAEDLANPFVPDIEKYPKLKPVIKLLDQLSERFKKNRKYITGKVMHTWIAAIDPDFRSQGLYTEIGIAHVQSARKKGFDFIYSDFTNDMSAKIIRNFPVTLCNTLRYDDFEYDSIKPFEGLNGSASAFITPLDPAINMESFSKYYTTVTSK